MNERKAVGWLAVGAGAVTAILVTRELVGTKERRTRLAGKVQQGVGRVRHVGEELLHEGEGYVSSLKKDADALRTSVASSVKPDHDLREKSGNASNQESAVVAFMATVLVKGVSSYLQWRSMDKSKRLSSETMPSSDSETQDPAQMTVVELRREASSQKIDGRSGMNKQELVSALED